MGRKSVLIPTALEILREYSSRITIRQLFYRLVSQGIIKNSENCYNTLIQQMITARRDGRIPFGAFEDRTRHSREGELPNLAWDKAEDIFKNSVEVYENAEEIALRQMKNAYSSFDLPFWYNQPYYVEVWLEKEALANLFEPITQKYQVTCVPCKGYPSLSLLYDCSKRLRTVPSNREIRILYFGDYDMRGLNIQQNIEKNFLNDFGIEIEVIRYALTKEQIESYQLPPNPAKSTDTMARGWIETHGNVAWELDALEPHILENLVENAIKQQIDFNILTERNETIKTNQQWITLQVSEYLKTQGVE